MALPNSTIPYPLPDAFADALNLEWGIDLVSVFVGCALWGISCTQAFLYYSSNYNDRFLLRLLPLYLWVLDTVHQAILCVGLYRYLVKGFGDPNILTLARPELLYSLVPQIFVINASQIFFAYRIGRFSGYLWPVMLCVIPLSLAQMAVSLFFMIRGLLLPTIENLVSITWTTYAVHSINSAQDIFFAATLIYLLSKANNAVTSTNKTMTRILIVSVNTGLITAIIGVLTIITLAARPTTQIYASLNFLLCSLYTNSVLANMNARSFIRQRQGKGSEIGIKMTTVRFQRSDHEGTSGDMNISHINSYPPPATTSKHDEESLEYNRNSNF